MEIVFRKPAREYTASITPVMNSNFRIYITSEMYRAQKKTNKIDIFARWVSQSVDSDFGIGNHFSLAFLATEVWIHNDIIVKRVTEEVKKNVNVKSLFMTNMTVYHEKAIFKKKINFFIFSADFTRTPDRTHVKSIRSEWIIWFS